VPQGTGKATLVNLVDIPGHPRVQRGFERHLRGTRGIVFVVDALDFLPHKTETAE
jgi:signal recognition particle receptor subunit beta